MPGARASTRSTEPIPVAPGAHYACGGIRADLDGRTSVPGLYAVGEAASTGVHGANRLASNSLTEALITGRRAGDLLGQDLPGRSAACGCLAAGPGVDPAARPALAAAMSRHAGVLRDARRAGRPPAGAGRRPRPPAAARGPALDLATVEATNLHAVSVLVTAAALARAESRGCSPVAGPAAAQPGRIGRTGQPARHTVVRVDGGRLRAAGTARPEVGAGA